MENLCNRSRSRKEYLYSLRSGWGTLDTITSERAVWNKGYILGGFLSSIGVFVSGIKNRSKRGRNNMVERTAREPQAEQSL